MPNSKSSTTAALLDLAEARRLSQCNVGPLAGAMMERMADEIEFLRAIEQEALFMRDVIRSIAAGNASADTIRGQCRLLVSAYDKAAAQVMS